MRSISNVDEQGALHFFCAIEEGMVLRLAKRGDLLDSLQRTFEAVASEIGPPQVILGCDCVLRRVEVLNEGLVEAVSALMIRHRVVGFATYGEQFHGVHVNQTFTGIAIGSTPIESQPNG
ncbi:MAG: FIST C-terminal domain-containing protein [Xanthomonadales bacterium]|nr:FIST C-terminal domain-containing protein [Xanthomonadales bacterium]